MAKIGGPIWANYHKLNLNKAARAGVQASLEGRRALIFFRRAQAGELPIIGPRDRAPNTTTQPEIDNWRSGQQPRVELGENAPGHTNMAKADQTQLFGSVAIIDVDAPGGYDVIRLPAIPRELEWNSESTFASIKPIGRNSALYHFVGSEDKLQFEIDWYSTTGDSREVITNCRKIEALSKSDAYSGSPHKVIVKWGEEDALFSNIYFQITSAPYKMTRFNKGYRKSNGEVQNNYMLPVQAYQTVTLARISDTNLSQQEIEFVNQSPS